MTLYRVKVPFAGRWLTANNQRFRYSQAAYVKAWRESVVQTCRAAKLPTGITPVRIHIVMCYIGRRPVRDTANLAATQKAIVDGLVPQRVWTRKGVTYVTPGYGLLPDDDDRHVLATPTWELRPSDTRQPYVLLEVEHVTEGRAKADEAWDRTLAALSGDGAVSIYRRAESVCNGICVTGAEVGVPSAGIAYPHPDCELHWGPPDLSVPIESDALDARDQERVEREDAWREEREA